MQIALDYDDTYTLDPIFWDAFKKLAVKYGHNVFCVTKRGEDHKGILFMPGWETIHTNLKAKKTYCDANNIKADVWIDDDPINIYESGKVTRK